KHAPGVPTSFSSWSLLSSYLSLGPSAPSSIWRRAILLLERRQDTPRPVQPPAPGASPTVATLPPGGAADRTAFPEILSVDCFPFNGETPPRAPGLSSSGRTDCRHLTAKGAGRHPAGTRKKENALARGTSLVECSGDRGAP